MEERTNWLPTAKNWADVIDDLYHDATESNLRAILWHRSRRPLLDVEKAGDEPSGAGSSRLGDSPTGQQDGR